MTRWIYDTDVRGTWMVYDEDSDLNDVKVLCRGIEGAGNARLIVRALRIAEVVDDYGETLHGLLESWTEPSPVKDMLSDLIEASDPPRKAIGEWP